MEVNWDRLDPRLQCVDGLDDIMRFDLQHFCRRMQPPHEPHHRSTLTHFIAFIQRPPIYLYHISIHRLVSTESLGSLHSVH